MQLALKEKRIEIYNIIKSNKKWVICNIKAPAKKIQKSKKYAIIVIIFKFIGYYITLFHIYPFLFLYYDKEYFNGVIFFIHIILNITLLILFIYLICSDPGYIKNFEKIKDFQSLLFKKKETFLDFCFKCSVFKTESIKHCSICDKCCKRFDHHCLWLDNCIGKNNYFFFKLILYNSFFDISITIIISIVSICIFFVTDNLKEHNNKVENINATYKFLKYCLGKLEIDSNYIHIISIIILCFNIFIMIPLIYLLKLHFKLCKKLNSKINPEFLHSEITTSIGSDQLFGSVTDNDDISLV